MKTDKNNSDLLNSNDKYNSKDFIKVLCPYEEGFEDKYVFSIYLQDNNIFLQKLRRMILF